MTVRIEKSGKVWTVIHSRPEARNAMDPASADALEGAFNEFNADAEAGVAVLWGEGGAFCAGFDLKYSASLVDNPNVSVEVGGHTDNTGRRASNVKLSDARANAVRDYLIGKGVNPGQLTARGYGPDQPVPDNTTVTGRAANRRVELTRTN